MEHTLALIELAHEGDKEARDTIINENMGLVWSIVKRFANRGVDMEDLFQIGCIGLLKAVDKFDLSYEVRFSTYAVPMIAGEMKRFLRDDGMIKVSRSLKETGHKAYAAKEQLEKQMGREPTLSEIAAAIEVPEEELVEAMDAGAQIESLQQTIYQSEGNSIELMDKLKEEGDSQETALDRIVLTEVLGTLNAKERELIYKRYFQDMTQTAIAREMGMTQVQVSRMEKKILLGLRGKLL
ncbi:RNA polymerase sporulation sigma factor SigF [Ruminococcus gauvreauii]|uniref:RNA polymerase sporulation sigma factor SigF n=1 Tax=Ruminococcus gauvreauii TaxID=438033 RepID=A0ABY5VJ91_9FIRM|nr:RNA polymerase sporulation sigma factor SigF [Ruminococcus gauvreauii]UWP60286.1 RNA polymerase sporulation sigma factor SigF [Ruminococcus gauvreauii]